jgi:O-antigen/teichoic acid export membrane protein
VTTIAGRGSDRPPGRRSIAASLRQSLARHLTGRPRELLRSLGILFAYNRVGAVFTAAAGILAARWMGPTEFGRIGLVAQVAAVAALVTILGAHSSMYRFLPSAQPSERDLLQGSALTGSLLGTLALGLVYLALRSHLDGLLRIPLSVWDLAAAASGVLGATMLTESFLRGQQRFTLIARLRFASALTFFGAFLLLFVFLRRVDARSYFAALLGSQVLFSALALSWGGLGRPRASPAGLRQVFGYGFINTLSALLLMAFTSSDLLVVNYFLPPRELGVYNMYQGAIRGQFSALFFEVFCVVFIPTIASMDKLEVHRKFRRMIPLLFAGVALGAGCLVLVGVWLAGSDYPLGAGYVLLTAAGVASVAIFQIYSAILSMEGVRGAWLCLAPLAAGLPISCGLQVQLTRRMGLSGAMLGVLAGNLVLIALFEATVRLGHAWLSASIRTPAPATAEEAP